MIYENTYPDVDVHFYGGASGAKMSFVCRPGSNPSDITIQFEGQNQLELELNGFLKLLIGNKEIRIPKAIAYQVDTDGTLIPVQWSAGYDAFNANGTVTLDFGAYDNTLPMIFQIGAIPDVNASPPPGLCWGSYFGGDGTRDDIAETTEGADGSYYVTGGTNSSFSSFPVSPGFNISNGSWNSTFVAKFSVNDELEWRTFYGGALNDECLPTGIATKGTIGTYVVGVTTSTSLFHVQPGNEHFLATASMGRKGFIARFDQITGER